MPLPREYTAESCPIARSLEVIGERWTLLIVRDAFYGVRRFSDFHDHLGIPKAVLAERLALLVEERVLTRTSAPGRRDEYVLTAKGHHLWPTIWSLITWGNENYLQRPAHRTFKHVGCGGSIGAGSVCSGCGQQPDPGDLVVHPPRRPGAGARRDGVVSRALGRPHRLLEPIRGSAD
ncbi:winged helix-turn-helix transcriptional regulator [Mycobacterium sp. NPDC048908]|uniref:winged helix-turn-helix transcriptional regulator n=1 Tax=Mycobacterium sp. NPDC048908 TaxID=3364292 RepID=UPI00372166DC